MGKPFKVVANSDAGDADHYGGNDIDNMAGWLNSQSDYHTYTYFVYKESTTYKAKKGTDGTIAYSDSDFKTVIQAIIDDISPAGTPTIIKLAAGDFLLQAQFTIPASRVGNITIEGMGPGLTNILIGSGFNSLHSISAILIGTSPTISAGNTGTLTANKLVNSLGTTMSSPDAAKFAVGDYALLRTALAWCNPPTSSSVCNQGEIHKVSASSGTSVTLDTPAFDTYNTADTAELINITAYIIKNITFRDLAIKKDSGFTGNDDSFFHAKLCDNLLLDNVQIIDDVNQFDSAISLYSCINSKIVNCKLIQNPTNTFHDQYGITIRATCQNVIIDHCQSVGKYRHPFEYAAGLATAGFEGPPRHIVVSNCEAWNSAVGAFDSHGDGEFITVANCTVGGTEAGYGFYSRCKSVKFTNCTINSPKDYGFNLEENAHGCEINNCTVSNSQVSNKNAIRVAASITNIKISNCYFKNINDQTIGISDGADTVSITNNIFDSCSGNNTSTEGIISLEGTTANISVIGNIFGAGTAPASSNPLTVATAVNGLVFTNNNTIGMTNHIPYITTQTDAVISNNIPLQASQANSVRSDIVKTGSYYGHTSTNGDGVLNGNVSAIAVGTGTTGIGTDDGIYRANDTAGTINSISGHRMTTAMLRRANNCYFKTAIYLNSVTNVRVFAGLANSSSAPASAADPLNALSGVGVWLDSDVSADWKAMHNDSSGASVVDALSTPTTALVSTLYTIEIMAVNDTFFRVIVNGVITDVSANIPSTSNILGFRVYMENTTGASRTFRMYYANVAQSK